MQPVVIFLPLDRVAERDLHRGLADGGTAMDAPAEIFLIGDGATARDPGMGPIEAKLESVEQRRLAAAVEAANQDDGFRRGRGCQLDGLPLGVEAEVVQRNLVE